MVAAFFLAIVTSLATLTFIHTVVFPVSNFPFFPMAFPLVFPLISTFVSLADYWDRISLDTLQSPSDFT